MCFVYRRVEISSIRLSWFCMFNHSFAFVTLSSYFNILRLSPLKYSWGLEGRGPQKIKLKRGLFLIRYTRPSHPKVCCVSNVLYTTYVQRETNIDVIPDSVITFLSPESAPICWCPPPHSLEDAPSPLHYATWW